MIREDLPKIDEDKMSLYCPYCNHGQKEPLAELTYSTVLECENCGRTTLAAVWLYEPLKVK